MQWFDLESPISDTFQSLPSPIVNNGDWKHVEGMHQEEEEGKRPNVPWALTAVVKQKQFTTVEVF